MRYFYPLLLTFFSFQFISQIPNYVPTNGLVGWWPFTGNANDLSGNGYNGIVNGATLTTDRFGNNNQAYNFGSSHQGITVNQNVFGVPTGNLSFTISFWHLRNAAVNSSQEVISNRLNLDPQYNFRVTLNSGGGVTYNFLSYNNPGNLSQLSSSLSFTQNWENIVVVGDLINNQMRMYRNGQLIGTNNSIQTASLTTPLSIGYVNNFDPPFQGKLDDIGIWNRALSQQEITALYTGTAGTVASLNCNGFTQTGNLYSGQAASNVSISVPYTGGNAGFYAGQNVSSTGVTGLTATLTSGTLSNGSGSLSYTLTGTPSGVGNATFALSVGGQSCNLVVPITALSGQYPANSVFCANGPTAIVDVTNPTTGKTWMDRNLGASQVATSSTDAASYGDLYQWGRRADGHQCRTSPTTATLSSVDQPAHGNFIIAPNAPNDWRSPQNTNLWQGVTGVNNPCPSGYRVPTEQELDAERLSWGSNNDIGAFGSPLKFPNTGVRNYQGFLIGVGSIGAFWVGTISGSISANLSFDASGANMIPDGRSGGYALRCIKETIASVGGINCNGNVQTGNLIVNQVASNVSVSVPYTAGNGGYYNAQTVTSTGVSGLTLSINAGYLANGNGNISYTVSGTPSASGSANFAISLGGQNCTLILTVYGVQPAYPAGTVNCNGNATLVNDVTNPTTGKTWMDRNLGASQVATSSTDQNAYGDLYQWGRRADGHQCRTSPTTATLSSVDQPAHGNFILAPNAPNDWRSPQNTNLWQGVTGVNNPCPSGYRVPTQNELQNELSSWVSTSSNSAYNSILKFTIGGSRSESTAGINQLNNTGYYWASTVFGNVSWLLSINNTSSLTYTGRGVGMSVRCIKETMASVGAINCNGNVQTGNLITNQAASIVSVSVPYTGGNAGVYSAQTVSSTGVTGLTLSLNSGTLANGNGNISYTVTGTPSASGSANFAISLGGQNCTLTLTVYGVQPAYPAGTVNCNGNATLVNDVTNPTTGKTWMDRNLGASQVATSSTDQNAYGDLYQWGRRADGHQCRTSPTTATLSSVDQPVHGNFILAPNAPNDWRSPQNTNLWQGVTGVNNPCPSGYKVPTQTELDNERLSWGSNNGIGAFASTLKWPLAGYRQGNDGIIVNIGSSSHSVSSNISATNYLNLLISTVSYIGNSWRSHGCSVRCIKETVGSVGALNCNGTTQSGTLYNNQPVSSVTASVPYTGGNGGYYPTQSIASTGVTGLTASLTNGLFANGAGTLSFTISGTPSAVGTATFALNIGGQACSFTLTVQSFATLSINTNDTICNGTSTTLTASVANAGTSCVAPGLSGTLTNGLVGYWPFCGNANDISGNANHGTVNGATLTTDRFGTANSAYSFDGVDDFIQVINSNSLNSNSTTISGWLNAVAFGGTKGLVSRWNQSGSPCYNYSTSIDGASNNFYGATTLYSGGIASSNNLTINNWIYFTFIHDNNQGGKVYLNGSLVGTNNVSGNICSSLNDLFFGAQNNINSLWRFFNGKLDDIAIYNRALTQQEITQLYQQGQATYLWSNGATTPSITVSPTQTTTYTCTVTMNGVSTTQSQTITVNPIPSVNAGQDQTVFAGTQVTLSGSGANSYAWNNGVTNNTPFAATTTTTYTVTGTTNGCAGTDQVLVTVLPAPTLTLNTNDTLCAGQTTTLTVNAQNAGTPCAAPGLSGTLTNGLVGYWPFCGNANDASGNGNNGTVHGATLTTDRFGVANSAYSFDGVSNKIEVLASPAFNVSQFTLSFWVNTNSISHQKLISKSNWSNASSETFSTDITSNGVMFHLKKNSGCIGGNGWNSLNSSIPNNFLGNWQTLTFSYDGLTMRCYLNGSLIGSFALVGPIDICTGGHLRLGAWWANDTKYFNGKIDDFGFWNRALTQQEITQLYQQGQATYLWSNGATTPSITVSPTQTTTYTCTVTMNGVSTTQSQTITVNPIPTVNAGQDQTVFAGTQVTLSGSGANSYAWNNGVTNNTPFAATTTTTYTVTGTTNGCAGTDQVLVTVLPAPTLSINTNDTLCAGQTTTLTVNAQNAGTPCAAPGLSGTLTNGLVGYWPFCGNANDISGNANHGTVNGATLTTDRFGTANSAYSFDGVNDYIEVQDNASLNNPNISVGLWLNTNSAIFQQLLYKVSLNTAQNEEYSMPINLGASNKINLDLKNNSCTPGIGWMTFSSNAILNNWVHASFTHDGSTTKFYLNGALVNSQVANFNIANCPGGKLIMGIAWDLQNGLNGKLDDIGIWNRALTQQEITQLYQQGQATYSWSPGGATTPSITVTPAQTTTYTCTVTMNGATTTQTQTITVNALPTVNAGQDQTVFAGTQVTLSGSGANSYAWNNGVTNNTPFAATTTTTYTVTGISNGCSSTDQVLVTVLPAPNLTINTNDTICNGTSTTLTASVANAGTSCVAPGLSGTLTNGLVGYWPFCGNANDLSGNGNNGTVNGATLTTDRFGVANQAYSFDQSQLSHINIPHSATLNFQNNNRISISTWLKTNITSPTNPVIVYISKQENSGLNQIGFNCALDGSSNYLLIKNGISSNQGWISSPSSTVLNSAWNHVLFVFDTGIGYVYVNGTLIASIPNINSIIGDNLSSLQFGKPTWSSQNANAFTGQLDDIGIWNRALTQPEITQLYNAGQATYSWSPGGAATPSITVTPAQTTSYTCTITMNGASTTQSQTITVNALPTVNAGANQTVCAGTALTLNGSGAASYSWNNNVQNGVAFVPNATTTYTVTGTNANGCINTAQTTVTVNPLPAATITAQGATTFCQNNSLTLNANAGAGLSYQWYNNGTAINAANSATLPVSTSGSYTVQVTNANNCSVTSSATAVSVNALPAATITPASATTFCQGGSVVLNANVGQGLYYQWNLNGSPINGANAASYTANASGNYSLDVLNSDGCSATATAVSVTVNALPTVSAGANQTLCAGTAITLSGTGAISYTWNNNVSNGVAFTPASTQTYTVTGTNANGCTNTAQVTVTINALPTPSISYVGSPILCQGSVLALNSTAGSSYLWSNGQTTQTIQVTQGGAYTVQVTNANGCVGTSNAVTLTVNPLPAPSITAQGPTTFCQGGSVVLTSTGATSYSWSTNATTQSITVTTSGLYQVTVVDNKGCSGSSAPIQVTVLSPPNASITTIGSTALCAGQSTSLSAPAGNTYLWSNGASTQNITVNTAGTYSVQVTNAAGCSANSNVVTISVNPVPVANLSANGATSFCSGGSVVLTASAGASYLWNTGATTQSITVNSSGTFNVTVTGAGGCNATSAATSVTVNALPSASITATGNTTFCAGNSVLLSASNGNSYLWSNGATTPSISATAAGSYSVSVTNGAGCSATSTPIQITVNPLPSVSAGANQSVCIGGQVTLSGSGANTYTWNNNVSNGVAFTPASTQTYTVTGTNANGCSNTAQVTVAVNALPAVSAGANQNICSGSQVTLMGSGANAYAWNNGVINGVAFTPANTQTYTVTGTNANGCSNTAQVTVTVNALPTASINASGSTTLCAGSSVNLSASNGSSYLWSNGATTQTITASSAGNYSVQVANAAGCNATSTIVNVVVNPLPAANITANGSTTFCAGGSVVLSAAAGASYLWNTGATSQTLTVNTSGTYTVTVTSNNGCVGTSSPQTVTVSAQPSTSITANGATSFCAGGSVLLSAPNGGTYLWSTGATTPSISVSTAGNYSVTVTNGAGCSATSTPTQITVNPLPAVSAGANQSVCSGAQVTLNGSGATSYTWNNGVTNGVAFTPATTQTYTVTGTNANGCSNTAQVTVTVNALPVVSAGANQSICSGAQVTLNGSGATSYAWNNGVTNGVAFTPANTQTYTVTGTNANGCANTAQVTVTVNALPAVSAGANQSICAGAQVTLNGSGATSYAWNNGVTNGVAFTPANTQTYTVTGTAANGCTNTAQVTVTVNALPAVSAGANQSVCAGNQVILNGSGATSYSWNNGVTNGVAFTPANTQTYTVTGTNANGCSNTAQMTVTVNALPTASISASGSTTLCAGSSVNLSASNGSSYLWSNGATTQTITASSTGNYSVQVTNAAGCSATSTIVNVVVNPLPAANITANGSTTFCAGGSVVLSATAGASYLWNTGATSQTLTVNTSGTYTVTVTSNNGCVGTSSPQTVTVSAQPSTSITANGATSFCAGGSVLLSAPNGGTYLWSTGATTPSISVSTAGNYSVTVTNGAGCSATSSPTQITVNPLPAVSAGANQSVCAGNQVTLNGSGATSYSWNNGVTNGVAFTPATTQTYTVTGTDANGCSNTAQVMVTVNALPVVSAGANQSICSGAQVTLNGSGATSYAWNNGVTNGVAFTPANTQTYTVTGTNANGCSNTAQVTVTVNALPAVSAGANQSICSGVQVTLNGSGATSYAWNNGVTNGVAFTPANTQTYTVTGTNANGCSNTAQVTVTVNALPTANAGSNALINCVNNPNGALLGAAPQAGFTYQWSPATGLSSANLANPIANPINSTAYTLTVTQTSTGCSNTASVNVTVNSSAPQANAGQNSSITCVANTNGVNIGSNPSAGLTYAWTPSTGLSASNISNPVANPLLTTTYTLTITNTSNGCTGTGTVTVSVNNTAPTVNAGQDQTVCAGQSATLNATGANTYTWNNGAIQGVAFTPSNTQTYTVQGTNTVNGCTATDQVIVTLNALPTVSAGTNQTVCAGTVVTLTGSGASSYAWNNGVSNGVAFSPTNTQTYTVTGTDANGCSNTAQVTVTVNALPVVSAGPNQSICAGTAVTLNGSGATNYTWNNGVSNGVAFTPTNTQTYTVTGTNANGCQGTAQVTVTVNAVPTPTLVANGTAPYCPGTNVVMSTPSLPGHSYQWYFGQNIINGAVSASYTATTAGTYYVKVTAPGGCFGNSNSITVSYLNPNITALGPTLICQGGSVALQTVAGAGYQYSWMKNGMTMINPNMGNVYTATSGGTYTVKIVTPSGCVMYSNSITVTLIQNPSAAITAQGSTSFCNGSSVTLTASNNANAVVYQWRKNGVNITGATSQSYTATQAGTYTVVIANQACPATSAVVSNGIYVNVFPTPNPWIYSSSTTVSTGSPSTLYTITGIGLSYQWYKVFFGNSMIAIPGATQATYVTNSSGIFRVKVTNMYGCWKYSNTISIASSQMPEPGVSCLSDGIHVKHGAEVSQEGTWYEETTVDRMRIAAEWNEGAQEWVLSGKTEGNFVYITIEEELEMQWMRVADVCTERTLVAYPNPTWNVVYLKGLEAAEKHYELQDVMGRTVAVGNLSSAQNAIDMSNLAPGTYRLVLQGYGVIAIVKE
jgi:hypothetical protein